MALSRIASLARPLVLAVAVLVATPSAQASEPVRRIVPAKTGGKPVPQETMRKIYDEVKTPFKYGIIVRGEKGLDEGLVDCPSVFRYQGKWYMVYVCMNKVGYETHLASSDDLLTWKKLGRTLEFSKTGWDAWQADAGIALQDHAWGGSCELQAFDGKYWMSYLGGALQGYETDPLSIGIAWTKTPDLARPWQRIAENPVLGPKQPDCREFERETLYKSNIIWDKSQSLGWPFIMYYNGKLRGCFERIGMAVSKDMIHWERYGSEPVVDNGPGISGDPQIVKIGDTWVMFYFGAIWKPKAFDTFACSQDLVQWTKWTGPHLMEPSEPWDATYAHKPWMLKHNGVVYHFYCAVGNQGRVIALATSKDLRR